MAVKESKIVILRIYVEDENSDEIEWKEVLISTLYEAVAGDKSEDENGDEIERKEVLISTMQEAIA